MLKGFTVFLIVLEVILFSTQCEELPCSCSKAGQR